MLRERKASMADRSLSSLTGELLLLATAAAAFATLAARRLGGDENRGDGQRECAQVWGAVAVAGAGGGGLRVGVVVRMVVWDCVGMWCAEVYQKTAGNITRTPEKPPHDQVTKGARRGGQSTEGGATQVKRQTSHDRGEDREKCRKDPG